MNPKILAGFLAGAALAASAVYFIESRKTQPPVEAVTTPAPAAVATQPAPAPEPVPATPPPAPEPVAVKKAVASNLKPSPKPPVNPPPVKNDPPPVTVATNVVPAELPPAPPPPPPPPPVAPEPPPAAPEPPQPRSVTITSGTLLNVRLRDTLTTEKNHVGDTFVANFDRPLVVDGLVIAERGARVNGKIVDLVEAGRVKGLASIALELNTIETADGQTITLRTARFERQGPSSKEDDVKKVGAGAVVGTIIGAIAGGGKGAAIGAAAGGAAGGGVVVATRGKPAVLASETLLSFKLDQPVTITERR